MCLCSYGLRWWRLCGCWCAAAFAAAAPEDGICFGAIMKSMNVASSSPHRAGASEVNRSARTAEK